MIFHDIAPGTQLLQNINAFTMFDMVEEPHKSLDEYITSCRTQEASLLTSLSKEIATRLDGYLVDTITKTYHESSHQN